MPLENFLNQYLRSKFPEGLPEAVLNISAILKEHQISEKFLEDVDLLGPFGQENEKPVFVIPNLVLHTPPESFGREHQHVRLKVGAIPVLGWNLAPDVFPLNTPLNLAVQFSWNYWQSRRSIQAILVDWKTKF